MDAVRALLPRSDADQPDFDTAFAGLAVRSEMREVRYRTARMPAVP